LSGLGADVVLVGAVGVDVEERTLDRAAAEAAGGGETAGAVDHLEGSAHRRRSMPLQQSADGGRARPYRHQLRYRRSMAMTLRLDENDAEALRRRAAWEGRSMQKVAREAVREYIERRSRRELLDEVLDEQLPRYAEALERLGR